MKKICLYGLGMGLIMSLAACVTPAPPTPSSATPSSPSRNVPAEAPKIPAWESVRDPLMESLKAHRLEFQSQSNAETLKVIIPLDSFYAKNATEVPAGLEPALNRLAEALRPFPGVGIKIIGHTDSTGPELRNQELSFKRAEAAGQYLVRKGLPAGFITTAGKGELEPLSSNKTEQGRIRNRRLEVLIGSVQ